MRYLCVAAVIVSAIAGLVGKGQPWSEEPPLDKQVVQIVGQVGALYKNAKTLQVEGKYTAKIDRTEVKRNTLINVKAAVERPNRLSIRTTHEGDADAGLDVVADGKRFLVHARRYKQYVEPEAIATMDGVGRTLLQLGPINVGMLFINVLVDDPAQMLMDGVTQASYAGEMKLEGQRVHHLKFKQAQFDWEMWVAAEGKPWIMKMKMVRTLNDGTVTTEEVYRDWKLDQPVDAKTFTLTLPKDAEKVDRITPPQPKTP